MTDEKYRLTRILSGTINAPDRTGVPAVCGM